MATSAAPARRTAPKPRAVKEQAAPQLAPGQVPWEDFVARYRKPGGSGKQEAVEAFLRQIAPGTAMEYKMPEGVTGDSARSTLYSAAKRLDIQVMVTSKGCPDGVLLVGVPTAEYVEANKGEQEPEP